MFEIDLLSPKSQNPSLGSKVTLSVRTDAVSTKMSDREPQGHHNSRRLISYRVAPRPIGTD